jgi:hypothetical protein
MLSIHLHHDLAIVIFISGFLISTPYAFLLSHIRTTCPAGLIMQFSSISCRLFLFTPNIPLKIGLGLVENELMTLVLLSASKLPR